MEFDLTWLGAPTTAALAQVVGHVQLSLEKGQVIGLKPGAGRVLGFTSIAALPRRLALDFSDLTDKGLAFDSVHGDFDLRDGNAYTENVLLKGPAAEIGANWPGWLEKQGLRPNCSSNGQRRQFAVHTGREHAGMRAGMRRGRAVIHASVQTAAERPGARVLSYYRQLG